MKLQAVSTALLATAASWLLASCQVTAAQNDPAAPVTQVQPASLSIVTRSKGTLPRALWVWDATAITNPKQGKDLFDFCAAKGISVIYLSMGDIFAPKQREDGDSKHVTAPVLGKFLLEAHTKKIQVEALDGDSAFALEPHHAEALARLRKALEYNKAAAPSEKLDGFQWDTEPYTLPDFKDPAKQKDILKQYLDGAAELCAAVDKNPSLRLGFAIPAFFDDAERTLEWNGTGKPAAFHLMDQLNALPSSYVVLMAYRDKALGPNGTVEISRDEVEYAGKNDPRVKVWIGQETMDVTGDPPSITFFQEGENSLEQALGQIETAFKKQPALAGFAIHHWASYRTLKPGDPVAEVKPLGPITDPLTILAPKTGDAVPRRMEVTGTAKPGGPGVKVKLAVRPEGDIWYDQGETDISEEGTWTVVCRFGNENTPADRGFEVRAQLLDAAGKVLTEQISKVKTK